MSNKEIENFLDGGFNIKDLASAPLVVQAHVLTVMFSVMVTPVIQIPDDLAEFAQELIIKITADNEKESKPSVDFFNLVLGFRNKLQALAHEGSLKKNNPFYQDPSKN